VQLAKIFADIEERWKGQPDIHNKSRPGCLPTVNIVAQEKSI